MNKKQKRTLARIAAGAGVFVVCLFLPESLGYWRLAAFLCAYAILGWDVLYSALRNILRGQVFDENFLMALATVGAFILGEYPEGVAVMLFYQVGEWFQDYAVNRSRRSIADLMDIRPDSANVLRDGEIVTVSPDEVAVGETIVVNPGERIALDGVVLQGQALVDTAALTGESVPRKTQVGNEIYSGCIVQNAQLHIKVTKQADESTVAKILEMVENASSRKSRSENFITRFARYYTPIVVGLATLLAVLPPLITGQPFGEWLHRALIFLVISCPCALVISVPLTFFGGIGGASRQGILIKGSNYMEALAGVDTIALDKTGTLTHGVFSVSRIAPQGCSEAELLEWATLAEHISNHPISQSLKRAYGQAVDPSRVSDAQEVAGQGMIAQVDGARVLAGNMRLMQDNCITLPDDKRETGTIVHVARDGAYKGYILIRDEIKPQAAQAIADIVASGVRHTVMLTGDAPDVAQAVADELGIESFHAGLLPLDKVTRAEELLEETHRRGKKMAFVGDGINDAPVLSRADVGIAMGALGADAAIEAADMVIMDDNPQKIAKAIAIARKTIGIARQNIIFALVIKVGVMVMGALGTATMWEAVFADVGVSVLAILNAMRALKSK